MKINRPIIFLLIALAIAAFVLLIEDPRRPRVDDAGEATFSPGFDSDRVKTIEVSRLIDGARLRRDGERWLVSEMITPLRNELVIKESGRRPGERWHRADRTRVTSALGSFGGLGRGVVVSTKEENRRLYQVDATGLRVRLLDEAGEAIDDVIIGKNGPDMASSYIRRADEDEVYLVGRALAGVFSPNASDWRELRLWALKPEDIAAISVSSKEGSFEVVEGDGRFDDIARRLSSVSADGFADDPDEDLGDPLMKLVLELKDGDTLRLQIFPADAGGRHPARFAGVDETYLLSEGFVKRIPRDIPTKGN